ncbi:protein translocase subunit SecF [Neptuniibacter caesariensis]|uniref:Protein-export membrane protein SecF n=1 Tax=Neptuniibacter caesariensis TaxID=207954 RepID=A0A7U8GRI7_NEPCE|nr:protein translocase subunit SecF [Neptuniibacter caesariensis]EAR60232.1 protein export protein SecF [Oceanospirillum sp. MED92] [Neptuniibacter caesariensis]
MSTQKIYNFMGFRKIAAICSVVLLVVSLGSLVVNGLKFGLDFTGGSLVEIGYEQPADLNKIRGQLKGAGYDDAVVQTFGSPTDILIRLGQDHDPKLGDKVLSALQEGETQQLNLRRNEFVGAQVGEELREQGGMGMLLALFMIMVYVAFRFQIKFSLGAVAALAHDVLIVLGFFSLLQIDFDLTVLAAILAVIGYSLNDTIVVSDRIRENFRKMRKGTAIEIMNASLTQTLGRTLVTSLTTLLVLVALAVFGGEMIHGFAIALLVGVLVGTYSSIYVSANVLVAMNISKEDLMPPEEKEQEVDDRP